MNWNLKYTTITHNSQCVVVSIFFYVLVKFYLYENYFRISHFIARKNLLLHDNEWKRTFSKIMNENWRELISSFRSPKTHRNLWPIEEKKIITQFFYNCSNWFHPIGIYTLLLVILLDYVPTYCKKNITVIITGRIN